MATPSSFTKESLKATAREFGLKVSGTRDDLECRIADWIRECPIEELQAASIRLDIAGRVIESFLPHCYRQIAVRDCVVGLPTHNGYCTDSIVEIVPDGFPIAQGVVWGAGVIGLQFWFNDRRRNYLPDETIHVSARRLIEDWRLPIGDAKQVGDCIEAMSGRMNRLDDDFYEDQLQTLACHLMQAGTALNGGSYSYEWIEGDHWHSSDGGEMRATLVDLLLQHCDAGCLDDLASDDEWMIERLITQAADQATHEANR